MVFPYSTVYIGFYDQPPSQESGSLNPVVVAKLSGFSLGLATRWSLKAILAGYEAGSLGITTFTVAISLRKGRNLRSLNTRLLLKY